MNTHSRLAFDGAASGEEMPQRAAAALGSLWRARWRLVRAGLTGAVAGLVLCLLLPPRYTAESLVQFTFAPASQDTPAAPSVAALDGLMLVESAARVMSSRAVMREVVIRLGLDRNPAYARPQLMMRLAGWIPFRHVLPPDPVDSATDRLMSRVKVDIDRRSYLVDVSVTLTDPVLAQRIVNALTATFARERRRQALLDDQAAATRALEQLSLTYGAAHPAYQKAFSDLVQAGQRLKSFETSTDDADMAAMTGLHIVPASLSSIPSGPGLVSVMVPAILSGLLLAALLALWRDRQHWLI